MKQLNDVLNSRFSGYYTKAEIDNKLKGYVINKTPAYQLGFGYDGTTLKAYNGNTEIDIGNKSNFPNYNSSLFIKKDNTPVSGHSKYIKLYDTSSYTFTAPQDGFLSGLHSGILNSFSILVNNKMTHYSFADTETFLIPVSKNDIITFSYSDSHNGEQHCNVSFNFYLCK